MARVYVISKSGKPLMPTKPARARHLLKAGEAKAVRIADHADRELYNGAAVTRLRKLQNSDTLIWEVYSSVSSLE